MSTDRLPRAVIALTGAALFMIVLDNLIVLSTLPTIGRSLHASLAELTWVVDAYILAFAVLILTGAALGERFGRRRMFVVGLLLFTGASAAAGFAPNAGTLIAARAVQGIGSAVLMPLTLTLLTTAFPPERRSVALGMWSSVAGVGLALGPIVGGLLTDALSWHWIFWVNAPIGVIAAVAAPRVFTETRGPKHPVDVRGLLLSAAGLLGIVWATVRGNDAGWSSASTLGAYAVGAAFLAAFAHHQRRTPDPLLPRELFASRAFSVANAVNFTLGFAMFGAFYVVVEFLSAVRGVSPVMAGVWTLPWTAMPLFVSPLAGRLAQRVAPATLAAIGQALVTLGVGAIALLLAPGTAPVALALPLWAIGVGIGLSLPSLTALGLGAAPAEDVGVASGTLNTARQLGAVFGVAVPVAVYAATGAHDTAAQTAHGLAVALTTTTAGSAVGAASLLTLVPLRRGAQAAARRLSFSA